ncbi:class II aldolase/adducin family protein [Rhodococcus ruber]|uniref:Class II aldolase/adducin family protein n=1 Tax=Rhodococcus ruber TaxID=1830 RepID=A0ABT4MPB5_9NOCA|nr:class II aldolase/adducin family protein [Rhodococcus ruber]MCZ4521566.1 class II aldolase/adducin family protein [Rhodococcus ruber]
MTSTLDSDLAIEQNEWQLRVELAAVYRLVAHFKMTDLVFSHISQRLPGSTSRFLINPYGLMFDEITASNLVVVGDDGEAVESSEYRVNPAGFVIHSAIHSARPDAHSVLHTHSRYGCAVAAQQSGLLPVNQTSMEFYGRLAYHDYEGVALDDSEKSRLVADLGTRNALVLRNHGLLTVGSSARRAFLRMFYLERACEMQILAQSTGQPLVIPDADVCERTAAQLNNEKSALTADDRDNSDNWDLAWNALQRMVDRLYPDYRK